MLFILLTLFTIYCHAILDCLSSTESLILLIRFCMYSVCSFRYMFTNLFCAFLSFRALILVGFLLLHLKSVFTAARFFLTANVSHGTLGLALRLVGMHSAAASKWVLTKFSLSSAVFLPWQFGDPRTHPRKRNMPRNSCAIIPFLIYKDVVYQCFSVIWVAVSP